MAATTRGFLLAACAASSLAACAPDREAVTSSAKATLTADPGDVDVLFVIDDSGSMSEMQQKMLLQLPLFVNVLEDFPQGMPNLHFAVVSSDMGAPSDVALAQCSTNGDGGNFFFQSEGSCSGTTLASGATFISNVAGSANYTGNLADVMSCISALGQNGCGFEQPLAAVARALGADGSPAPAANAGFLRPNAELAILFLTSEDDCSAPPNTTLYSLNGGMQDISNPLGPIANYRCNEFGHLCADPTSATPTALEAPPLDPPADASGNPKTLPMTSCGSNDTGPGLLVPVDTLVSEIKALKPSPDTPIVVGALAGPATPYVVSWAPGSGSAAAANELWPNIMHACGPAGPTAPGGRITTDGSFGDPSVRLTQFVQAFGSNGMLTPICDNSFEVAMSNFAMSIGLRLAGTSNTTGSGGAGGSSAGGAGGTSGTGGAAAGGYGGTSAGGHGGTSGAGGIATGGAGGTSGAGGAAAGGAGGTSGAGGIATGGAGGTSGAGGIATGGAGGTSGAGGGAAGGRGDTGGNGGGAGTNGGIDAGQADANKSSAGSDGCSCETAGGGSPTAFGAIALVAGVLVSRRRRPRNSRTTS